MKNYEKIRTIPPEQLAEIINFFIDGYCNYIDCTYCPFDTEICPRCDFEVWLREDYDAKAEIWSKDFDGQKYAEMWDEAFDHCRFEEE